MKKTTFKIYFCFIACAVTVALALLCINFVGIGYMLSDEKNLYSQSPRRTLEIVDENLLLNEDGTVQENVIPLPEGMWCILLNAQGDVIWEKNMPADIPAHYTLVDVAKMTRWFLEDYPVYVQAKGNGLIVLGYPKNAVGKYDLEYSMDWFADLPKRALFLLLLNICLAVLLACVIGMGLYRRLRALVDGIRNLRREVPVYLKEKGILREVARNINEASNAMERKNAALKQRDGARSRWIAGISHDIRTPLAIMMGYAEELSEDPNIADQVREKAWIITRQAMRINRLIEDLNLSSALEYDMQPAKKKPVRMGGLLRRVVSDLYNGGLEEKFVISVEVHDEKAVVMGDEHLLERAVYNLLSNSIRHNPSGCHIAVKQWTEAATKEVSVSIADDGQGVPEAVLSHIHELPASAHGMGLPMAFRIVHVHGGKFQAENRDGFLVKMTFPEI